MKALFLNHNVAGTGTYQRAYNFARELTARGHDITLVTTSPARRLSAQEHERDGVRIIEAPDLLSGGARNGWDGWNASWRVGRLGREHFDLIHGFDSRPAVIVPALVQRRRNDAPLFLDWADWWGRGGTIVERSGPAVRVLFGPVETWFEERFRTSAVANTTISELLRERCIALGVPAERVLSVPNGCTPPHDLVERDAARRMLGQDDAPLLLHLGVMQKADADFLFAAFRILLRALPEARLVLVGRYRGSVPVDLAAAVVCTGYVTQPQLEAWLGAADAGVIPLRDTLASRARWPGKINEYLTAGLPVVLPHVGAAARLVAQHGAGAVCEPDPDAFAVAMRHTLLDAEARRTMAKAGRALASGALAWSAIADRLVDFYAKMSVPVEATRATPAAAGVAHAC